MFTYVLISRESHLQLQVLVHVRPARNNHCQLQAYKIPDFVCFKAPVTGFNFCKRCHHYLLHSYKWFGNTQLRMFLCVLLNVMTSVCLFVCLHILLENSTSVQGYILTQGGNYPWLNPPQK